jgi:hypothetical protein
LNGEKKKIGYLVKEALYKITYKCDFNESLKRLNEASNLLQETAVSYTPSGQKRAISDEKRETADIICVLILQMYLSSRQKTKF